MSEADPYFHCVNVILPRFQVLDSIPEQLGAIFQRSALKSDEDSVR
jgi:hypothetical protein